MRDLNKIDQDLAALQRMVGRMNVAANNTTAGNSSNSGNMILVASYPLTAAVSQLITGFSAGNNYKLLVSFVQETTAGLTSMLFNSDTGSNYNWTWFGFSVSGSVLTGSVGGTDIELQYSGDTTTVGAGYYGEVNISTKTDSASIGAQGVTRSSYYASGSSRAAGMGAFSYIPSITTATIRVSAGAMTGNISLYQIT